MVLKTVSALLFVLSFASSDDSILFIEHGVYVGGSDGVVMDHPGLIFRLYHDGKLVVKEDGEVGEFQVGKQKVKRIERDVMKLISGTFDRSFKAKSDEIKIGLSDSGVPVFYSHHGTVSMIRVKTETEDFLIISPFVPKQNLFSRIIEKTKGLAKKKRLIQRGGQLSDKDNVFAFVLGESVRNVALPK